MAGGSSLRPGGCWSSASVSLGVFPGPPLCHGAVCEAMGQFSPSPPSYYWCRGGSLQLSVPAPSLGPLWGTLAYPSSVTPAGSSPLACTGGCMGGPPSPAEAMRPKGGQWLPVPSGCRCPGAPCMAPHHHCPVPLHPPQHAPGWQPRSAGTRHHWLDFSWAAVSINSPAQTPGQPASPRSGAALPAGGGRGHGRAWLWALHAAMPAGKTDAARASPVGAIPLIGTVGDKSSSTQMLVLG